MDHESDNGTNFVKPKLWDWHNDPFEIRRVTLGGDVPGLRDEIDFLKRKCKADVDESKKNDK